MGWQQDYKFPTLYDLVRILHNPKGIKNKDIINIALRNMALPHIEKIEQIIVEDDPYGGTIYGTKITLSNGDIYKTVLNHDKSFTQDGNYGCDVYEWSKTKGRK